MQKISNESDAFLDKKNISDELTVIAQDSGVILVHEEEGSETPLKGVSGRVRTVLTLNKGKYIALIEESDRISIYSTKGRLIKKVEPSGEKLLCLIEFSQEILGVVYKNYGIDIWNVKSFLKTGLIEASVISSEDAVISDHSGEAFPYGWFILYERDKALICSNDGEAHFTLSGFIDKAIRGIYLYRNHCVINYGLQNIRRAIWDNDGNKVAEHKFSNHGRAAQLEISKNAMMAVEDDGDVVYHAPPGESHIGAHTNDRLFLQTITDIADSGWKIIREQTDNPTPEHFPHSTNPISEPKPIVDERRRAARLSRKNEKFELFWNFFNRPEIDSIRVALGSEMRKLRSFDESLVEKKEKTEAEILHLGKTIPWIYGAIVLGLVGVLIAFLQPDENIGNVASIAGGVFALFFAYHLRKAKSKLGNAKKLLSLVTMLQDKVRSLICEIRDYRRGIIGELPIMERPQIYSGKEITELIDETVRGPIRQAAMNESGIVKEDIVYENNEPIVLRDWAYIQEIPDPVRGKIDKHNLNSFWVAQDKQFVFAVQFVQFIFLAEDKLDVFTCFYDFVQDSVIWKEAHAFYYRDVTNISKRDVDRSGLSMLFSSATDEGNHSFPATEISFSVASGERISLTILKSDSFTSQEDDEFISPGAELEDRVETLEAERDRMLSDSTLSSKEKSEIRSEFAAFIEQSNMDATMPDSSLSENKADHAIANIRMHVRASKERKNNGT